ncbi:hypothetical protein [Xenorhabdus mauleonii]|uniref:hypothetical protein n=1 Tax=Xenorhabdus mauleonii TaxID=351675 RepID=UPI001113A9F1|nr:hypothetical protein [Xenorhabdus mauleonii]
MKKFNFIFIFCLLIAYHDFSYCNTGGWHFYISSGNSNFNGNYAGVSPRDGTLPIKFELPSQVFGRVSINNANKCTDKVKVNNYAVLNLENSVKFRFNGAVYNANLAMSDSDLSIIKNENYYYENPGFVTILSNGYYSDVNCMKNNSYQSFENRIKMPGSIKYKIEGEIPFGVHRGSIVIGKLGYYGEPTPQAYWEKYTKSLSYGTILNLNYIINITNSCAVVLPDKIALTHDSLTTTNFEDHNMAYQYHIQCQSPVPVNFSLTANNTVSTFEDGKIKLKLPFNNQGVESLLVLEGYDPMLKGKNNIAQIKVGSGGELLTLSSTLIKKLDVVTPGTYSAKAVLEVWID